MSGAWGCPHEFDGLCQRVHGAYCKPGMRGCVLDGKVDLADEPSRIPRWPSTDDGEQSSKATTDDPRNPQNRPR